MKNENSEIKNHPKLATTQNFLNQSNSKQASNISYDSIKNTENSLLNFRVKSATVDFNSFNKQSPKCKSGILREHKNGIGNNNLGNCCYINEINGNFSMLDVPFKNIVSGTKLPVQYKKMTQEEMEDLFTPRKIKESKFTLIKGNLDNKIIPDKNKNSEEEKEAILNNRNSPEHEEYDNLPLLNKKTLQCEESEQKEKIEKITNIKSEISHSRIIERKIKTARPFENRVNLLNLKETTIKNNNFIEVETFRTDTWMPSNMREYERNIKTAHIQRLNEPNYKDIRKIMTESNVFFTKYPSIQQEPTEKIIATTDKNFKTIQKDFRESDIFNLKTNKEENSNINSKQIIYGVSTRSNSEWSDKISHPSLLNHTSVKYHILNPKIKHIFKTKEEIANSTQFNPVHRQKSLCEYRDLTRVGQPNINKDFRKVVNKSPKVFNRNSDICAKFMDTHKGYKNLVDPPFSK